MERLIKLVPNRAIRIKFREILSIKKHRKRQKEILLKLRGKVANGEKIRVAFFVIYDSVFPAKPIFELMIEDSFFEPFILVIPDVARGDENMLYQLNKTYKTLSAKYKNIEMSYDNINNEFIDYSDSYDIVCTANPYDEMTHEYYTLQYLRKTNTLSFYLNYSYSILNYTVNLLRDMKQFYQSLWLFCVDSEENLNWYKKYSNNSNAIVAGYCKLDSLIGMQKRKKKRKMIILAPHHTVKKWEDGLMLSNFMKYANIFLLLPQKYPQIDFVFRPHPLLIPTLRQECVWGGDRTEDFLIKFLKNTNVIYQEGGDYFDTFINSDGMIHDCGSFALEYLFSKNPVLYLLKDEKEIVREFTADGQACLKHSYLGYNAEDIFSFIDKVILKNEDALIEERLEFVQNKLMTNYPATEKVLKAIKRKLIL